MNRFLRHVLLPATSPAVITALYFTPVELLGCRNRGLAALAVVGVSTIAAFTAIALALWGKSRGIDGAAWWLLSAVIFTLPLALLIGPLG